MFKLIQPQLNLANYIKAFWIGSFDTKLQDSFIHLAHATTTPQLIFHLAGAFDEVITAEKSKRTFHAGIYGQSNSHKLFKTDCRNPKIMGVQFYPHALSKLLSVPATVLSNETVEIEFLWGREGKELTEDVFTTGCDGKRVELISTFLESKLNGTERPKDAGITKAIRDIEHHKGQVSMSKLVDQSCLSQRQFERSFKELAGFSPKAYIRIVRFEAWLEEFAINQRSLTDTALKFGYYDQAHLNHDFKAFTGLSPLQYRDFYSNQYT